MKKTKLQLKDLEVMSFTTSTEKVLGGGSCDCSLPTGHICDLVCTETRPNVC
jgi:hypothetical protein